MGELSGVKKRAVEIISFNFDIIFKDIGGLGDKLEVDSLSFINAVVALEEEFGFEFDDEMMLMSAFPTIVDIIRYVEAKAIERGDVKNDESPG